MSTPPATSDLTGRARIREAALRLYAAHGAAIEDALSSVEGAS